MHQLWKKLLPVLYKRFGETRKLLAVADEEYSAALVEDLKNMKDFSYEVTGIILLDRGEDSEESRSLRIRGIWWITARALHWMR